VSIFEVQHQARAHRVIQRALNCGRMPHAYLFAGPEGVGKEMLATRLAKVLLCSSPARGPMPRGVFEAEVDEPPPLAAQGMGHPAGSEVGRYGLLGQGVGAPNQAVDACGTCEACNLVRAGTHPDLILIYRQLNKQHPDSAIRKQKALFVGVEIIRHFLIERAGLRPNLGRAKVFVVREAERLNESSQNALLKTLEEPPPDTFIILLTDAMDRMLPTTRSRCQQVLFQSLPVEFVAERLRALRPDADPQALGYAARHAGGSLGSALRLVDDGLFAIKRAWGDRLARLQTGGRGFAPHLLAKPFMEDGDVLGKCVAQRDPEVSDSDAKRQGLQTLLATLTDFYLDALRRRTGAALPLINEDQPDLVAQLAGAQDERSLRGMLTCLSVADNNLGRNAHAELTLETMFIGLARARSVRQPTGRVS
jgi:DNA polymerase III subunit delta'